MNNFNLYNNLLNNIKNFMNIIFTINKNYKCKMKILNKIFKILYYNYLIKIQ